MPVFVGSDLVPVIKRGGVQESFPGRLLRGAVDRGVRGGLCRTYSRYKGILHGGRVITLVTESGENAPTGRCTCLYETYFRGDYGGVKIRLPGLSCVRSWGVDGGTRGEFRGGTMMLTKRITKAPMCDRRICKRKFCIFSVGVPERDKGVSAIPIVISREVYGVRSVGIKGLCRIINRFHSCGERRRGGGHLVLSIFTMRLGPMARSRFVKRGRVSLSKCIYGRPICEGAPLNERVTSLLVTIGETCKGSSCVPYVA